MTRYALIKKGGRTAPAVMRAPWVTLRKLVAVTWGDMALEVEKRPSWFRRSLEIRHVMTNPRVESRAGREHKQIGMHRGESEEKKRERTGTDASLHTENKAKLTQSDIPGSASDESKRIVVATVIHRRPPEADRLPRPFLPPPPPQLHSSGSHLPHYSFRSSPLVTSAPRVAADLFSSLPPGPAFEPPEPNIWD